MSEIDTGSLQRP